MRVRIEDGRVTDVELRIYEPPRFFEALLRGRVFTEAPDITARICGICPVAYQMSAVHAMEQLCGVEVDRSRTRRCAGCSTAASGSRATRCTSTCSTRPTSSATRAPSSMARDHPEVVERGAGAEEGRQRDDDARRRTRDPPDQRAGRRLLPRADAARARRRSSSRSSGRARSRSRRVRWTAGFDFPDCEQRLRVRRALARPADYPIERGRIVSDRGLDIDAGRVRRALRRGARGALERAALAAARARHLPRAGRSRGSR